MQTYLKIVTIAIGAIAVLLLIQGVAGLIFQKVDEITSEEFDEVAVGADTPQATITETYFAEIDKDGNVLRVIVADQAFIDSGAVGDPKKWIETFKGKDYLSKDDKINKTSKKKIPKIKTPVIFDNQVATSTL